MAPGGFIYPPLVPRDLAGHHGGLDGCSQGLPFERGPTALGEEAILRDLSLLVEGDEDKVGPIPFAQVAAILDLEEIGYGVAGLCDDGLERKLPCAVEFEQDEKGVLDQGKPGWAAEVIVLFLFPGERVPVDE